MKKKVIITRLPKAGVGGGVGGSLNINAAPWSNFVGKMSEPDIQINSTLNPVPKENANLEAEQGEVAMVPGKGGIPNTFKVGGDRHHSGGTPLNLPSDSFIFSDTKKMLIKDKAILSQFGMSGSKSGYTPAEIAKKYDIGLYKKILLDKNTDKLQKETAEQMIANYNLKLAKLAIVQESMKGFPQGLPQVAMPYIEEMGMDPAEFVQANPGDSEVSQVSESGQFGMGGSFDRYQMGGFNQATPQNLEMFRDGGPKVTSKINLPTDAIIHTDINDPNIKPEDVKKGKVYIQKDGKYYKVVGYQPKTATSTFTDKRISKPELNSSYGQLVDMFTDPGNEDFRKDLVADYRTKVAALKPTKNLTQADIDVMSKLSDEDVIKNFLDHELQIFALHSAGIDGTKDTSGQWDKSRKVYQDAATKLGFTPSTPAQTAAFQAAYKSLVDLSGGKYKDKLQDFELKPIGKADEGSGKNSNISGIDGWFGNTTVGQAVKYRPISQSLITEEVTPTSITEYPLVAEHLKTPELPDGAPWWIQDIIKTGNAATNLANLRQFNPWQATAPVTLPDVTFADPTRELAANSELARIAADTVGMYTGPQAFNARFSEIQGNAMKGAADTLGKYNNINIGLSNQQSAQNAQVMNVANQQRAGEQTNLWDKYQMTRQQFANAKTQAKDALVNAYTNGITNKANTYNLNQLYPQFAIDPMSGGQMYFKNPREFFPKNENNVPNISEIYNRLLNENPTMKDHPERVWDIASKMAGITKGASFEDMMSLYQKQNPAGAGYPPAE